MRKKSDEFLFSNDALDSDFQIIVTVSEVITIQIKELALKQFLLLIFFFPSGHFFEVLMVGDPRGLTEGPRSLTGGL